MKKRILSLLLCIALVGSIALSVSGCYSDQPTVFLSDINPNYPEDEQEGFTKKVRPGKVEKMIELLNGYNWRDGLLMYSGDFFITIEDDALFHYIQNPDTLGAVIMETQRKMHTELTKEQAKEFEDLLGIEDRRIYP